MIANSKTQGKFQNLAIYTDNSNTYEAEPLHTRNVINT